MNADRIEYYANQLRGIPMSDLGRKLREVLRDATNEAKAEENEACAKVCEYLGREIHGEGRDDSEAFDCADAIRARRNHAAPSA